MNVLALSAAVPMRLEAASAGTPEEPAAAEDELLGVSGAEAVAPPEPLAEVEEDVELAALCLQVVPAAGAAAAMDGHVALTELPMTDASAELAVVVNEGGGELTTTVAEEPGVAVVLATRAVAAEEGDGTLEALRILSYLWRGLWRSRSGTLRLRRLPLRARRWRVLRRW